MTAGFHAAEAALAKEVEGRQQAEALGRPSVTRSEADAQDAQALRSAVAAALAPTIAAHKRAQSSVPRESASHAHSTGAGAAGGGSGSVAGGSSASGDLVLLAEPIRCVHRSIDFGPATWLRVNSKKCNAQLTSNYAFSWVCRQPARHAMTSTACVLTFLSNPPPVVWYPRRRCDRMS